MGGEARRALVTGAAGGIGAGVAGNLLGAGWEVVGCDRVAMDHVDLNRAIELDLADFPEGPSPLDDLEYLDLLVHCAAVMPLGDAVTLSRSQRAEAWTVNVDAVVALTRRLLPALAGGGSIVVVGSVHSLATSAGASVYAATKGAVAALVRGMALELCDRGVRVNAVAPGAIDTPMLDQGLGWRSEAERSVQEAKVALAERTPLQRLGRPDDVAEAVRFLGDQERSGFITGQTLVVDGGVTARLSSE